MTDNSLPQPERRWRAIFDAGAEYLLTLERTRMPCGRLRPRTIHRLYLVAPDKLVPLTGAWPDQVRELALNHTGSTHR
jgi:hypothetical protein